MAQVKPNINNFIAWWALDEKSGNRADSIGSFTLTDTNTVLFGAGIKGNAGDFETSNSECLIGNDWQQFEINSRSVSMFGWYKGEAEGSDATIIGKWDVTGNQREWMLRYENGIDDFEFFVSSNGTGTSSPIKSALNVVAGQWYGVGLVWDQPNEMLYLYVYDVTASTLYPYSVSYTSGFFEGTAKLCIGAYLAGGSPDGSKMDGLLDEICFAHDVWTQENIEWLVNDGVGRTYDELAVIASLSQCIII